MFCISDDQKFSRPFCVVLASIDSSKSILSRCVGFSSEKVSEKSDKKVDHGSMGDRTLFMTA